VEADGFIFRRDTKNFYGFGFRAGQPTFPNLTSRFSLSVAQRKD
jgi:hypothetical protein